MLKELVWCRRARHNKVKVVYAGSSSRWHDPYQSPYACFKHMGEEIFKLYKKVYGLDAPRFVDSIMYMDQMK